MQFRDSEEKEGASVSTWGTRGEQTLSPSLGTRSPRGQIHRWRWHPSIPGFPTVDVMRRGLGGLGVNADRLYEEGMAKVLGKTMQIIKLEGSQDTSCEKQMIKLWGKSHSLCGD